jgi:NDP-sugar pyrophosphorylase family protein
MKAMIFAAGLGTRLKPITDTTPKALVPVGGKPLLQHTIEKLKLAGFDEIIINIHHFGDQIIDFVKSNKYFDIRIEFSDERASLLDTGGGIKKASHFFNDNKPFLVHNIVLLILHLLKITILICQVVMIEEHTMRVLVITTQRVYQ